MFDLCSHPEKTTENLDASSLGGFRCRKSVDCGDERDRYGDDIGSRPRSRRGRLENRVEDEVRGEDADACENEVHKPLRLVAQLRRRNFVDEHLCANYEKPEDKPVHDDSAEVKRGKTVCGGNREEDVAKREDDKREDEKKREWQREKARLMRNG